MTDAGPLPILSAPDVAADRRRWLHQLARASAGGAGWLAAPWAQALAEADAAGLDRPPEPQPARPVSVPPMAQHRLGNGLTVVTVPRRTVPVVTVVLMLKVGQADDPPGQSGLAAMTATLLTKGCRRDGRIVDATALARQAEALGGELATSSDWRSLSVSLSVAAPRLPEALALLADVMRHPLLRPDELVRSRVQVLDGLRVARTDTAQMAERVLRRTYWGAAAYGAVTTAASVERLQLADIERFHGLNARPELAGLVVAGDAEPARVAQLAQALLGDWSATGALRPRTADAVPQPLAAPLVLLNMPGSGQSAVALAAPFAAEADEDRRTGEVANALLGGGYSARLNQAVRIRRGLSYGAFSSWESFRLGGMVGALAQTRHASAAEVLQVMRGEVARLVQEAPPLAELAARQASLVGSFVRGLQTTGGLARLVASHWAAQRPLADLQHYASQVQAVTPQAVHAFARQHWAAERLRAVIAGDLAVAGPSLSTTRHPEALRIDLAALDLDQAALMQPSPPGGPQPATQPPASGKT